MLSKESTSPASLAELPLVLTVQQLQAVLQVSKTTAYELVHSGAISSVRIGRAFRVSRAALAKYLGLTEEVHETLGAYKGKEATLEG